MASIVSFPTTDVVARVGVSMVEAMAYADVSLLVLSIYTLYYVHIAILKLYW